MKTKYTPGNWIVVLQRNEKTQKLDIGIAEAAAPKRWIARITPQPGVSLEQDMANAELLASAESMLKLLEDLYDMASNEENVGPRMLKLIEATIVRARSQGFEAETRQTWAETLDRPPKGR